MAQRIEVTQVDDKGHPVSPLNAAREYGNIIGCIVREVCNINDDSLRGPEQNGLRNLLLSRLHERYKLLSVYDNNNQNGNLVNQHALLKFSKAFSV